MIIAAADQEVVRNPGPSQPSKFIQINVTFSHQAKWNQTGRDAIRRAHRPEVSQVDDERQHTQQSCCQSRRGAQTHDITMTTAHSWRRPRRSARLFHTDPIRLNGGHCGQDHVLSSHHLGCHPNHASPSAVGRFGSLLDIKVATSNISVSNAHRDAESLLRCRGNG